MASCPRTFRFERQLQQAAEIQKGCVPNVLTHGALGIAPGHQGHFFDIHDVQSSPFVFQFNQQEDIAEDLMQRVPRSTLKRCDHRDIDQICQRIFDDLQALRDRLFAVPGMDACGLNLSDRRLKAGINFLSARDIIPLEGSQTIGVAKQLVEIRTITDIHISAPGAAAAIHRG
ncbi:MAG: hypothetical protein BGP08_11165 [Rhizobiales bacterium 64-17]|nr:MAG: hypothetical protein BGP08_11165 [Rhizobiales bacterium 64-17]